MSTETTEIKSLIDIEKMRRDIRHDLAQEYNWNEQQHNWSEQQAHWKRQRIYWLIIGVVAVVAVTFNGISQILEVIK